MWMEDGAWLTAAVSLSGTRPLSLGIDAHIARWPYALQPSETDGRSQADIGEILRDAITLTHTAWVRVTDGWVTDTLAQWPWITFTDPLAGAGEAVLMLPALVPHATISFVRSAQISVSASLSDVVAFTNAMTAWAFGTAEVPPADCFEASDAHARGLRGLHAAAYAHRLDPRHGGRLPARLRFSRPGMRDGDAGGQQRHRASNGGRISGVPP
jgi:hypothetical protein